MTLKIPIIILTKDEPDFLLACVRSIVSRTNYPFELIIVDNASKDPIQKKILEGLSLTYKVIHNQKNNWVLGFNLGFHYVLDSEGLDKDYYVLTDGDILVPLPKNGVCWLTFLVDSMNKNFFIGKLGLGLDISAIKRATNLSKAYENELNYLNGFKFDELVMAPVDTTMAIYRSDLFVHGGYSIYPGHASLMKPYYYVFRTYEVYQAKHLGWRKYKKRVYDYEGSLHDKIKCFTYFAAYIDPNELKKAKLYYQVLYRFKFIFKAYWAVKLCYFWLKYIIKKFPRGFNEVQSKVR